MSHGFPTNLISLIKCSNDGEPLTVDESLSARKEIYEGRVKCKRCGHVYVISEGVLDMLSDQSPSDASSKFEMKVRDSEASDSHNIDSFNFIATRQREVSSTLRRLGNMRSKAILELGCGTGIYTRLFAKGCSTLIAVDFSRDALLRNARSSTYDNVGLVRADVSTLALEPNSFDMALSTLYSNLPTRDARMASTKGVQQSLKPLGKYVLSAHQHEISVNAH